MKRPSLAVSIIPVLFLIGLLVINVIIFKDNATAGPNQIALFLAAVLATGIGVFHLKLGYKDIESATIKSINLSLQATLILLVVGSLIGVWIQAGIVPAMIFYGLKLIHPSIFLPVCCIVCCIVSLSTGSSWSTTGTIGIAFIGIGTSLGMSEGLVAGAIISGAYFGDKMSPLSDTTNLAPAITGTDLFTHIRHMVYTSGPAIGISIVLYAIIGFFYSSDQASPVQIEGILNTLDSNFTLNPLLFISPGLVLLCVMKKMPALPAMVVGVLSGALTTLAFQSHLLESTELGFYGEILQTSFNGFTIESGNVVIDKLLNRGGMSGMLSTVWLIVMAMVFGGALEGTGMLASIADAMLSKVKSAASVIGSTIASCIFLNITASDQYLAIIVPGRMFKKAYEKYNLHPKNFSRALEDSGTVTSALVPWNTGGAYNATVLNVATLTYLPFCFFNLLSPIISLIYAYTGYSIEKLKAEAEQI